MKEKPSYFQVKEIIKLPLNEKGQYSYLRLKKINYNTLDALKLLSKKFCINLKEIGFAGNKDKKAITTQYISVPGFINNKVENLKLKDIELKFIGKGNKRINLGDSIGNKFKIKFTKKLKKTNFCENYFDEQRFGINNANQLIGKLILENKFKEIESIVKKPENTREYNIKLRFYLHAYQSYLFNIVLSEYLSKYEHKTINYSLGKLIFIKKKIKNFKIPLVSFDAELKGEIGEIYKKVLKKEKIKLDSFIIRSNPFLISDTQFRDAFFEVKDLIQKKDFIYFSLPKGSYATILLKKLSLLTNNV